MLVAALDPGKNVGYALVDEGGRLLDRRIVALVDLHRLDFPEEARLVVGDGTGSYAVEKILARRNLVPERVDETGTSLEARRLYFRDNPPGPIVRLLPRGLWWPGRSVDDYAAYAIALRFLGRVRDSDAAER